jgi:arylsulfatase A-like enzyme
MIPLHDWVPTLMAAIGQPDVKGKLLKGYSAGGKTYRVHLDGYSQLPMLQDGAPGARKKFQSRARVCCTEGRNRRVECAEPSAYHRE